MRRFIEISDEAFARLESGRCVEGSLRMDEWTGRLTFKAYNRRPRGRAADRMVCQLEHGWLKESAQRFKFFSSVKKSLGIVQVKAVMERELGTASHELELDRILDLY